jgi:hypothetical protein
MTSDNKEFVDNVIEMFPQGEVQESEHPGGIEMQEWCFTNDKTNPAIRQLFHIFHESVFRNKLGVMHAKPKDGGPIQTLIVGVEVVDGQVLTFPLAKLLTAEEQDNYLAPDGEGGFLGDSTTESSE